METYHWASTEINAFRGNILGELLTGLACVQYSYGHLLVVNHFFYGIIHSINWVLLVLYNEYFGPEL